MYLRKPILVLLLTVAFSCGRGVINTGPATVPFREYRGIEVERHIYDKFSAQMIEQWKVEVQRRFSSAYLVFCHGEDKDGVWYMFPQEKGAIPIPVEKYAKYLRHRMPDRIIVFVCCNPHHHGLGIPGVYHARDSVWYFTDKHSDNRERSDEDPGCVGNIFEFDDA